MKQIKVAQIGTKHVHGRSIFASMKNQPALFQVLGVAEPDPDRAYFLTECPTYQGYPAYSVEELLNLPGLQAVTIETDEPNLCKYAIMAAEKGLHIHMDKPGGTNLSEFRKLIRIAKEKGLVLSLGYMYRYNPMVQELLAQVKAGEFGHILSVEAQMNCLSSPPYREMLNTMPGGQMFFLGCHLVDMILQLQGQPERIIPLNRKTYTDGVDAWDFGMAAFCYPRGISFAKTNAAEIGGFARRQLVVVGTKKTAELKPWETLVPGGQITTRTDYTEEGFHSRETEAYHRYKPMLAAFARMVAGEMENPYTLDYELELYETLLKCCEVEQ